MVEQVAPALELAKRTEVPIPDDIAIAYGKGLGRLLHPPLTQLQEHFAAIKKAEQAANTKQEDSFVGYMEDALTQIKTMLYSLETKKSSLNPNNPGWHLSFGEERATAVQLPPTLHPSADFVSKMNVALGHHLRNATAIFGFNEIYMTQKLFPEQTASIQTQRNALTEAIEPILAADTLTFTTNKNGAVTITPLDANSKIPENRILKTPTP